MVDVEAVTLDNLQQGVPLVTLKYIVHILFLRENSTLHDYGPSDYGQLHVAVLISNVDISSKTSRYDKFSSELSSEVTCCRYEN